MENREVTQSQEVEELDLEDFAKRGQPVPQAKRYVIRIDKERKVVSTAKITGREVLALVGKKPEGYKLYQHKRGHQPILIGPDRVVDLREPGVERFTTMPKDTTEGHATVALRREFRMPQADKEYLDCLGLPWETIVDGESQWLFVHEWTVPVGYNHSHMSVGLLIPPNYSDSQIDMAYFQPALDRVDGKAIANLSNQTIRGEVWQRWSRHRTAANPWRPGVDDIASHLGLVDDWLRREFEKK
jgi:hypothetical protein